jgi:hypothetical protein
MAKLQSVAGSCGYFAARPYRCAKTRLSECSPVAVDRSETWQHLNLKKLAAKWAYTNGFRCVGLEVRAPRSKFRIDAVAYRLSRMSESGEPVVALFECKQSRLDLSRDIDQFDRLQRDLTNLQRRRARLEELLQIHYPSLRHRENLFPEWDKFAGDCLTHAGYREVVAAIVRIQGRLLNCTKFARITRHGLANLHYLVTSEALITLDELPPGWGLLEANLGRELILRKAPQIMRIQNSFSWLECIAQSATKGWLRQEKLIGELGDEQCVFEL